MTCDMDGNEAGFFWFPSHLISNEMDMGLVLSGFDRFWLNVIKFLTG